MMGAKGSTRQRHAFVSLETKPHAQQTQRIPVDHSHTAHIWLVRWLVATAAAAVLWCCEEGIARARHHTSWYQACLCSGLCTGGPSVGEACINVPAVSARWSCAVLLCVLSCSVPAWLTRNVKHHLCMLAQHRSCAAVPSSCVCEQEHKDHGAFTTVPHLPCRFLNGLPMPELCPSCCCVSSSTGRGLQPVVIRRSRDYD